MNNTEKLERKLKVMIDRNKKLREQLALMRKHIHIHGEQHWYVSFLQDEKRILEEQYDDLQANYLRLSNEFARREERYKHLHIGEVHIKGILK